MKRQYMRKGINKELDKVLVEQINLSPLNYRLAFQRTADIMNFSLMQIQWYFYKKKTGLKFRIPAAFTGSKKLLAINTKNLHEGRQSPMILQPSPNGPGLVKVNSSPNPYTVHFNIKDLVDSVKDLPNNCVVIWKL